MDEVVKKADLKHVVVAVDGPTGPEAYHLNKDVDVTVILYEKHKVVANFAFLKDKLNAQDTNAILTAVAKLATGK